MAIINDAELKDYAADISDVFTRMDNQLDLSVGFCIFALVLLLVAFFQGAKNFETIKSSVNEGVGTIDIISVAFSGKTALSSHEKTILNKLLIALYAGFDITTASIILLRFSDSTRASMLLNLIAGFTGSGSSHVGACRIMMLLLKKFNELSNNQAIKQSSNQAS